MCMGKKRQGIGKHSVPDCTHWSTDAYWQNNVRPHGLERSLEKTSPIPRLPGDHWLRGRCITTKLGSTGVHTDRMTDLKSVIISDDFWIEILVGQKYSGECPAILRPCHTIIFSIPMQTIHDWMLGVGRHRHSEHLHRPEQTRARRGFSGEWREPQRSGWGMYNTCMHTLY